MAFLFFFFDIIIFFGRIVLIGDDIMPKNNRDIVTHLVSICYKKKFIPILTDDGKIGMYRFSSSDQTIEIFKKIRTFQSVISVYQYGMDPKSGNIRSEYLGYILNYAFSIFNKCDGGFNHEISLDEYKNLKRLNSEDAITKHLNSIGIVGVKEPIKPKSLDELLSVLNSEYKFRFVNDVISVGDESKLYSVFKLFFEKPFLDFFINFVMDYLECTDGKVSKKNYYSSSCYNYFKKIFCQMKFNSKEIGIVKKREFICELLKTIDISLVCIVDDNNFNNFNNLFGYISKDIVYNYAKHNLDIISSNSIFSENFKFPEVCSIKTKF